MALLRSAIRAGAQYYKHRTPTEWELLQEALLLVVDIKLRLFDANSTIHRSCLKSHDKLKHIGHLRDFLTG